MAEPAIRRRFAILANERHRETVKRAIAPLLVGGIILLIPVPAGLPPKAWYYFALFVAVIVAITTEPIPAPAVGLAGVVVAAMTRLVYDDPAQATAWALSGFANNLTWLIFSSLVIASGYEKTGLGQRIALWLISVMGRSALGLGYAVAIADLAIAPFTPSNTARSGGTIYPVIRNIPGMYGSRPGKTARRLGAYLMYTALATTCVTSAMFPTALAANLLAVVLVAQTLDVAIAWREWVLGFLPVGLTLLVTLPALLYWIYPPEVRVAPDAPTWAAAELKRLGRMSVMELMMLVGVLVVVVLWVAGSRFTDATIAAVLGVVLLVARSVLSWEDVLANRQAWNVMIWFATLVTLASGLVHVNFVHWLGERIEPAVATVGPLGAILTLAGGFFFAHYLFATASGHATALMPVFLLVAVGVPTISAKFWGLLFGYMLGLMGILTPYATGPSPIYYTSGYIRKRDFWFYGFVVGVFFFAVYMAIGVPWLLWRRV